MPTENISLVSTSQPAASLMAESANSASSNSWSCFMRQVCGKNKMERFVVYAAFLSSPFRGSGPLWRWMPLYTSSGV